VIAVAQVTGRLSRQACAPERAHQQIVQQVDATELKVVKVQEPPARTDAKADGSDCHGRPRDTARVSRCVLDLSCADSTALGQPHSSLQMNGTGGGGL